MKGIGKPSSAPHARSRFRKLSLGAISAALACGVLATAGSASASAGHAKAKGPVVKILAPGVQDSALYVIAQREGFFKQQGVNVDVVTEDVGSGSQALADFLSGQFQFINEGLPTGIIATGSGAKLTAVMATDISEPIQIAITDSFASSHGISATATPLKQLSALRGSHAQVAVTTTGSSTYYSLLALCKAHNLKCVLNDPTADLDIVTSGTVDTMTAGILAGKYDGIVDVVPQSVQPGTLQIMIGDLTPLSLAGDYDLTTSPAFIKAHKKIVQGIVTASVEAWSWAKTHQAKAEKDLAWMEKTVGITNAGEDKLLYKDYSAYWRTPLLLKGAFFQAVENVQTGGVSTSITYPQYNNPTFVKNAIKQLHLKKVPNTP